MSSTLGTRTEKLSGWGQYPRMETRSSRPERYAQLATACTAERTCIARGQGRAYGDAALSANSLVVATERLDRMLDFDADNGVLRAEAGLTLGTLLEHFVPRGWFPPVTPGTRHVSLGGCVASDVHGKNHHRDGSFGAFVDSIELFTADGGKHAIGPQREPELFHATTGGMGLTGLIGEVALRLRRIETAYILARHHPARDLDELMALFQDPERDDAYTVAWIDCLSGSGRGVFMAGHHAGVDELPPEMRYRPLELSPRRTLDIPFNLPGGLLNSFTVSAFNALYYRVNADRQEPFVTDFGSFFYPLDGLDHWYRLYGRNGFIQYQCVLPEASATGGLQRLLDILQNRRQAPFLAVLKRMGAAGSGHLSFPQPGYTLAVDLPVAGVRAQRLAAELDAVTIDHGGRVYLAKDACLTPENFRRMYPRYPQWREIKREIDPGNRFRSALAQRLGIPHE
ncbi:MAG: FAD-binding oxidoreductase [Acidihalobacter sp.]